MECQLSAGHSPGVWGPTHTGWIRRERMCRRPSGGGGVCLLGLPLSLAGVQNILRWIEVLLEHSLQITENLPYLSNNLCSRNRRCTFVSNFGGHHKCIRTATVRLLVYGIVLPEVTLNCFPGETNKQIEIFAFLGLNFSSWGWGSFFSH